MYLRVCIYIYTYIHAYTYIHTYNVDLASVLQHHAVVAHRMKDDVAVALEVAHLLQRLVRERNLYLSSTIYLQYLIKHRYTVF